MQIIYQIDDLNLHTRCARLEEPYDRMKAYKHTFFDRSVWFTESSVVDTRGNIRVILIQSLLPVQDH